jgi:hypothetical protein
MTDRWEVLLDEPGVAGRRLNGGKRKQENITRGLKRNKWFAKRKESTQLFSKKSFALYRRRFQI